MSNPIKHHYIPQSILSRFCDKNNQLHSFNKCTWKINKKKYSPAAVCYEENLHTLIHKEEKSYEIELFYSQIEGKFLEFLRLIDDFVYNGRDPTSIQKTEETKKIIATFLTISFWRVPNRKTIANEARKKLREIYDNAPKDNKELLGFDRKFIRDIERKKKAVSTKISQFLVLPTLLSNTQNNALQECWFYPTNYDLIISDDPVICNLNKDYSMGGNIYLPVSSRLCITNTPGEIRNFQQRVFNNAQKIVIANSNDCFTSLIGNVKPLPHRNYKKSRATR